MLTQEEMERAPSWLRTWTAAWKQRERRERDRLVVKCPRCAVAHRGSADRSPWQYAHETAGPIQLVMACGHFVKQGASMPEIAP